MTLTKIYLWKQDRKFKSFMDVARGAPHTFAYIKYEYRLKRHGILQGAYLSFSSVDNLH